MTAATRNGQMADLTGYSKLQLEIHALILGELERNDDPDFQFARKTTPKDVLERGSLLNRLFQTLQSAATLTSQLRITESTFVTRIRERNLFGFLATLIFARCTLGAAVEAVRRLVASDDFDATSCTLPLDKAQLRHIFGENDSSNVYEFHSKQAIFCTISIEEYEDVVVNHSQKQRLPYVEEKFLGQGAYGRVSRVLVAKGHFVNLSKLTENNEARNLARKDYLTTDDHAKEREIIKHIFRSNLRCDNILRSLGSLTIDNTYSLFMELAECDLEVFMTEKFPRGPPNGRADIVNSAIGLANGLNYLHSGIVSHDWKKLVCFHMDLKPSNVLVFLNPDGSRTWKLSDFGMSRVREMDTANINPPRGEQSQDFNRLFRRRQRERLRGNLASDTFNRRGEGSYLGPESLAGTPTMNTTSDIWSLGCVLSDIFVYLQRGGRGVEDYANDRGNYQGALGYQRYFIAGSYHTSPKLHPVTKTTHRELERLAHKRSRGEGDVTKSILGYVEKSLLVSNPKSRDPADAAMEKLREVRDQYQIAESEEGTQETARPINRLREFARKLLPG